MLPSLVWQEVSDIFISAICFLALSDMRYLTLFLSQLYASWPCLTWSIWRCFSLGSLFFLTVPDTRYLTLFLSQLYASWSCLTWSIWRCLSLSSLAVLAVSPWRDGATREFTLRRRTASVFVRLLSRRVVSGETGGRRDPKRWIDGGAITKARS